MAEPVEWIRAKRVSFGDVRRRLERATLAERAELLEFIRHHSHKIRPEPDTDWIFGQISSYLLDCILRGSVDHSDDYDAVIHSPFEAARELVRWFDWYARTDDQAPNAVQLFVDRVEAVYRDGDDGTRDCIETGFLEHALELPGNRQFFAHWVHDPLLAESYNEALRWGLAHTRPEVP